MSFFRSNMQNSEKESVFSPVPKGYSEPEWQWPVLKTALGGGQSKITASVHILASSGLIDLWILLSKRPLWKQGTITMHGSGKKKGRACVGGA